MNFKIFVVKQYRSKLDNVPYEEGRIGHIVKCLKKDNNYHERLYDSSVLKLNIDLDGYNLNTFIGQFIDFSSKLGIIIDESDFHYTTNFIKPDSHHVVIPKYHGTSSILKLLFIEFLNDNKLEFDSGVDIGHLGVGKTGKWYRMPNQTKEQVQGSEHIIQKGKLSDFVLHYISEESVNLDELETVKAIIEVHKKPAKVIKVKNVKDDNVEEKEIDLDLSNKYIKLLNILDKKRLDNYNEWIKVGMLIYSIGLPFEVFDNLSKKSSKYESEECLSKWQTFSKKSYTEGTLKYMAKHDNPEEYSKIDNISNFDMVFGERTKDTIQFHKRYLVENEADDEVTKHFDKLFDDDEYKVLSLKSPYGTGKTQLLKNVIEKQNPQRVLWLSYRVTLTNDILFNFQQLGFRSYQDGDYDADRLILQLESIHKLEQNEYMFESDEFIIPGYDLIIIDEIESILSHFGSETFKGRARETFEYLNAIVSNSKKVIALDGDLHNRSYHFLNQFGKSINLENTATVTDKTIEIIKDDKTFFIDMQNQLNDNKKIAIVSMTSTDATNYYNMIKNNFAKKKVYLYTGKSDDNVKSEHLSNVTKYWKEADVVIYSPTIEAGVNFDVDGHFYKIYGILSCLSTSQRAFYQMLSRIRKVEDKNILILNETMIDRETANYWTFLEVLEGMKSTRFDLLKCKYSKNKQGQVTRRLCLDNYDNNSVYNRVEELNKHKYYFMAYFRELGKSKGYIFKEKDDKEEKKRPKDKDNSRIADIVKAADINGQEVRELEKLQKQGKASEVDKLRLDRYYCKQNLGVDSLDETIMAKYYKKEYTIKNFLYLVDDANIPVNKDSKTEYTEACVKIINKLINELGFENVYDTGKAIPQNVFDENIKKVVASNELFTDAKTSKILFKLSKSAIDLKSQKAILGYINSILSEYSIKIMGEYINGKKKIADNYVLKLVQLNNIGEIAYNTYNKMEKVCDRLHLIKSPDTYVYKNLINE